MELAASIQGDSVKTVGPACLREALAEGLQLVRKTVVFRIRDRPILAVRREEDGLRRRTCEENDARADTSLRLAAAINARPAELAGVLLATTSVFFMFSAYSVLRPIRETMGITSGVSTLPALFWGTFVVMLAVQPVYGWLTSRFRRSAFLPWVYLFFVLN
ncbi:MAG TPA: hypothetical protein VM580_30390, partial [Labilithrix sp.]|nr:hypothetical protein [Labilithrix sp.]